MSEKVSGNLIIIGGAEDKEGDKEILKRVAKYIDPEKEKLYLRELMAHQVDGLIVGAHNRGIKEYQNANLPIIFISKS